MDSPTRLTSRQCLGPQLGHCWVVKNRQGEETSGGRDSHIRPHRPRNFPGDNIEIWSEIFQKFSYLVYDNEMLGIFSPLILGVNYRLANLEGF